MDQNRVVSKKIRDQLALLDPQGPQSVEVFLDPLDLLELQIIVDEIVKWGQKALLECLDKAIPLEQINHRVRQIKWSCKALLSRQELVQLAPGDLLDLSDCFLRRGYKVKKVFHSFFRLDEEWASRVPWDLQIIQIVQDLIGPLVQLALRVQKDLKTVHGIPKISDRQALKNRQDP